MVEGQIDLEKLKRQVLHPEIRLCAYEANGKITPAISVTGDFLPITCVEDGGANLPKLLEPLIEFLQAHIKVRQASDGGWALPPSHNNHPSLSIARQLLACIESGKAGFKVLVTEDRTVSGRKYMFFQVDKPKA